MFYKFKSDTTMMIEQINISDSNHILILTVWEMYNLFENGNL